MAASQVDEDIFKARLARVEVQKFRATLADGLKQCGNSKVGLANIQADHAVFATYALHAGQCAPEFQGCFLVVAAGVELDHVMAAQAFDQFSGGAFSDDLAMIDNGEAVAEALGLVHVMRGEEHSAASLLKGADDLPELAAALGIEAGGGLVEKENFWIADQSGGDCETLALATGKLANPGVGFLGELEFLHHLVDRARLVIEAGEEMQCFANAQLLGELGFLQ